MAIVMLGEYFFSPARTATVQLLYVAPKARGGPAAVKLLRALRRWAAQNGAADLHVNVTTGIQAARTDRPEKDGVPADRRELCVGGGAREELDVLIYKEGGVHVPAGCAF